MIRRHYYLLCALLLAAHLTGCRAARPATERPVAGIAPAYAAPRPDSTAAPITAQPGILSGLGTVFSTPAGVARRQAVRLARASVPRKLAKGAVYAPQAKQVVAAYKPTAAVVLADSGAIVTAIGKNKASAATAPGATATTTTNKGISWWWLLLLLVPAAWWVYKKVAIPYA